MSPRPKPSPRAIKPKPNSVPPAASVPLNTAITPVDRSVIGLIRDIQAGRLAGANLAIPDRRRVVEHLTAEGYSSPEIAEVLQVNERTITRDRVAVREANSLEADPALVPQMVGQLFAQAELAIGRLRRIARDRETPAAVKVEAERSCWNVSRELVVTFQRLGYLPTAPQEFRGQISSGGDVTLEVPGYDEIQTEVARLETIVAAHPHEPNPPHSHHPHHPHYPGSPVTEAGSDAAVVVLGEIKDTVARLAVRSRLHELSNSLSKGATDGTFITPTPTPFTNPNGAR